jgi:hypothetical protein
MAKSLVRLQARVLRKQGKSVKEIAMMLRVAKSSASLWTRDIALSEPQLARLHQRKLTGAELGRVRGALHQKQQRENRIVEARKEGIIRLGHLSKQEFFVAGLSLYWAEGNKMQKKIEFCNSDPFLVKFMIRWFKQFYQLTTQDFRCYVGINAIHRTRDDVVRVYWSNLTEIPLTQFTKTSFKKSKQHKIYENFNDHFGTLAVRVVKPSRIVYNMLGLIDALKHQ